jgi:hypothetical protein
MAREYFRSLFVVLLIEVSGTIAYAAEPALHASPAPEPISMALFLTGGGILLFFGRVRRGE